MRNRDIVYKIFPNVLHSALNQIFKNPYGKINDEKKIIFIHVPRTGGTSLSNAIFGKDLGHNYLIDFYRNNTDKAKKYYKFAFVRNPYDRLVSAYSQMQKNDINPIIKKKWDNLNIRSFEDLIQCISNKNSSLQLKKIIHFRSQIEMLSADSLKMDLILRFEEYNNSISKLEKIIGPIKIQKLNSSKRKEFSSYYDSFSADIVYNFYEEDFLNFNYKHLNIS